MNSTFVIEPKYDNGVGFLVLDNTRKLVRHFECQISHKTITDFQSQITIDVYEDGLIKIYRIDKSNYGFKNITLLLSLELTNGEDINEHYLDLLESIYSPFCVREYIPANSECPAHYMTTKIKKLDNHFNEEYRRTCVVGIVIELFTDTFKTLHIMKKMYETSFIN
jgi:hypothetical protein